MSNEILNKLRFNIQLFADEADNADVETSDATDAGSDAVVTFTDGANIDTPVNDNKPDIKDTTKAFSERLKRERLKIEQELNKKKQDEMDRIAISRGFKNWNDLEAFSQEDRLKAMGIQNPEDFNSYVEEVVAKSPIIVEAKQILENKKQQEQEQMITNAINEINKFDPDIKSLDDLTKIDKYDEFYSLVNKGYSLPDAYKVIAFDKITSIKVNNAKQETIANIDSKKHFVPLSGGASKDVVVPPEILATYHKNMPNMSEKEIKEHYSKFIGGNN